MRYVKLNASNVVTGYDESPQQGYVEAPDFIEIGWEKVGETWQKGTSLLASEASETDIATKRANLKNIITTLRTWKTNADSAVSAWDGQTQAQKNATLKVVIERFGTLCDRMADFIQVLKL
jgi:hypothetical protein